MTNGCALPREEDGVMFICTENTDTTVRRTSGSIIATERVRHIQIAGFGILLASVLEH